MSVCEWKHCLAWDLGSQVVGADSKVGWVDQFLSVDVVGEAVPVSVGGGEVEEGVGLGLGLSLGVSWPLAQLVLNQIHGVLHSLGVNGAQSAVNGLLKEINKCLTLKTLSPSLLTFSPGPISWSLKESPESVTLSTSRNHQIFLPKAIIFPNIHEILHKIMLVYKRWTHLPGLFWWLFAHSLASQSIGQSPEVTLYPYQLWRHIYTNDDITAFGNRCPIVWYTSLFAQRVIFYKFLVKISINQISAS